MENLIPALILAVVCALMIWLGLRNRKGAIKAYEDDKQRYTGTATMTVVDLREENVERWEDQEDGTSRLARYTVHLPTYEYTVDGKTYTYSKTLTVMITAYTHTGRKTSTGVWPKVGTVAVDKSVIPYGTKLYIPGYGFGVAQDTGVSGNHIDVFFDTEAECTKFGRKRDRTIYILD